MAGGFSLRYDKHDTMASIKSGLKSGGENSSTSIPAPRTRAVILSVITFAISPPESEEMLKPAPFPDDFARPEKWFRLSFSGRKRAKRRKPRLGKRGFLGGGGPGESPHIWVWPGTEKVQGTQGAGQMKQMRGFDPVLKAARAVTRSSPRGQVSI